MMRELDFSEKAQQYTFVEHYNTGLMLLKRNSDQLQGLWISPDGKKLHLVKGFKPSSLSVKVRDVQ